MRFVEVIGGWLFFCSVFFFFMVNTHACVCTWICFLFITATLRECVSNSMWEILYVLGYLRVNLQKRVWEEGCSPLQSVSCWHRNIKCDVFLPVSIVTG